MNQRRNNVFCAVTLVVIASLLFPVQSHAGMIGDVLTIGRFVTRVAGNVAKTVAGQTRAVGRVFRSETRTTRGEVGRQLRRTQRDFQAETGRARRSLLTTGDFSRRAVDKQITETNRNLGRQARTTRARLYTRAGDYERDTQKLRANAVRDYEKTRRTYERRYRKEQAQREKELRRYRRTSGGN